MANWAGALRGASEGLEGMTKLKLGQADMIYKEVSEQNRQRFQKDLQSNQQEFLKGMQEDRQEWETPFKEEGLEIQREANQLSGELRILQQQSLDTQRAIENQLRQQSNEIAQQRVTQSGEIAQAELGMDEQEAIQKRVNDEIKRYDTQKGSLDYMTLSDEQKRQVEMDHQLKLTQASLTKDQTKPFNETFSVFEKAGANQGISIDYARRYSEMSPEEQDAVRQSYSEALQGVKSPTPTQKAAALGKAIDANAKDPFLTEPSAQVGGSVEGPPVNAPTMPEQPEVSPQAAATFDKFKNFGTPQPNSNVASAGEEFLKRSSAM